MSRSETTPVASGPVSERDPFRATAARGRFPALRAADAPVFFDNAAGAQVPDEVIGAIQEHLESRNVQRGGRYGRSRAVDAVVSAARRRIGAFLNARAPEEIVFGANATSLIRTIAEAVRPRLDAGDRVVVTELDHEANIGPWLRLERQGIEALTWPVRGGREARLDLDDLSRILRGGRIRLVALPLASNASGRIVDVAEAASLARAHGAWTFVDAVHYGPHGPIDVQALGADFLAFSGYKIFGPHVGFLWGRRELLDALEPVRETFIPPTAPYAYEGGTQSFEAMAGMSGALHYLATAEEGGAAAPGTAGRPAPPVPPDAERCGEEDAAALRGALHRSMTRIRTYETGLAARLLETIGAVSGVSILGDPDPGRAAERVPTFSFTIDGEGPASIVDRLAGRGIQAREGHMYAPRLLRAAGFDPNVGVVRVSLCHYNTEAEIDRLVGALRRA